MKELFKGSENKTVEERLKVMEKVISRINLRIKSTSTAIVSPHIFSDWFYGSPVKGIILSKLLLKGNISKCFVIFRDKPKGLVKIEIKVLNNDKGETITFYTGVLRNEFDLSMDSVNGSMLTVSIDTMNEEYEINELWIALIWTPHVGNTTIKKFLVEDLIKEIEDEGV